MATDVVGSQMPALASAQLRPTKGGYGQNGFGQASSDLPGENTQSGFLPACDLATAYGRDIGASSAPAPQGRSGKPAPRAASKGGGNLGPQLRHLGGSGKEGVVPTAFGMKAR